MKTERGFVLKIDIGRGGLVTVTILFDDGTTRLFVIEDIDGDPERFNERLSMLGVLRDAMNRAEPVEFAHDKGKAGEVFIRVARMSRDNLASPLSIQAVTGMVLSATLFAHNFASAPTEKSDIARVMFMSLEDGQAEYVLDMQIPERLVAVQQFEMIRTAQESGQFIRLYVQKADGKIPRGQLIYGVANLGGFDALPADKTTDISGFVEALSLIPLGFGTATTANFALVRFTTAPEFKGAGGTVGLDPFTPVTLDLLTPKGSLAYQLFEAGLRDNLRMRVRAMSISQSKEPETPATGTSDTTATSVNEVIQPNYTYDAKLNYQKMYRAFDRRAVAAEATNAANVDNIFLVFSAELLAHLASASRPVWIKVSRYSLDHGPEGYGCTKGVPSSDLTPRTLRDLRIPYPAEWCGLGCFNPGIYCFQLKIQTRFKLFVDGKELCLFDSTEAGIKMAYACLNGCHEVCVKIEDWICDYEFGMDVYQLR